MAQQPVDLKSAWLGLKAEVDELAAERRHYLDFFESASEAYVVTDLAGIIGEANGAAVDLLQRRKRELRGASLAVAVTLDHRPEFRRWLASLAGDALHVLRTVALAGGERIELELGARLIGTPPGAGGISWRLRAAP